MRIGVRAPRALLKFPQILILVTYAHKWRPTRAKKVKLKFECIHEIWMAGIVQMIRFFNWFPDSQGRKYRDHQNFLLVHCLFIHFIHLFNHCLTHIHSFHSFIHSLFDSFRRAVDKSTNPTKCGANHTKPLANHCQRSINTIPPRSFRWLRSNSHPCLSASITQFFLNDPQILSGEGLRVLRVNDYSRFRVDGGLSFGSPILVPPFVGFKAVTPWGWWGPGWQVTIMAKRRQTMQFFLQ